MAKRVSPFADDFENLSRTAESVVQLVKQQEESARTQPASEKAVPEKSDRSESASKVVRKQEPSREASEDPNNGAARPKKPSRPKSEKASASKPSREWGKPVSLFNTRIPPEMAELLDDLVYQLRKKGMPRTKQELACEAIEDLLLKHEIMRC